MGTYLIFLAAGTAEVTDMIMLILPPSDYLQGKKPGCYSVKLDEVERGFWRTTNKAIFNISPGNPKKLPKGEKNSKEEWRRNTLIYLKEKYERCFTNRDIQLNEAEQKIYKENVGK